MSETSVEPQTIREVIEGFIQGRLQAKLDKFKPEETEKRAALESTYEPQAWLKDAARRVGQIQLASHTLKPTHPEARGTNLRVRPEAPSEVGLLGTWSVDGSALVDDVVGNAAALDVYKFLSLEFEGARLVDLALNSDSQFLKALSPDQTEAEQWCASFASIAVGDSQASSHTLAKQLFFPVGDGEYHLLAPLFPTSLVHAMQTRMREDRFGDKAKAARDARNKDEPSEFGFREYPELAIQKFGGTKPQNISQLNSERYGENWLLPSLPPRWVSREVTPIFGQTTVFGTRFGRSKAVREKLRQLKAFLESVQERNNIGIRRYRAQLVAEICDEAHQFAFQFLELDPGWTADSRCELQEAEMHWLDPERGRSDVTFAQSHAGDWPSALSHRFANWFNLELTTKNLKMDDDTHRQWRLDFTEELGKFQTELEADRA